MGLHWQSFVVIANLRGVNTPTSADCKLPMIHCQWPLKIPISFPKPLQVIQHTTSDTKSHVECGSVPSLPLGGEAGIKWLVCLGSEDLLRC